jgi:oligosaccharide repeat unit polymerase
MTSYIKFNSWDFLSPIVGLVVLIFLYSTASALYVENFGITYHGDRVDNIIMNQFYLACLIGLLGLISGISLVYFSKRPLFEWYPRINNIQLYRKMIIYSIICSIVFFPFIISNFNFLDVQSYGQRALELRLERMANLNSGIIETFLTNIPIAIILCTSTLLILRKNKYWSKVIGATVFLTYIFTNTMAGWRGKVVMALIIPLIYYHYRIKRIGIRKAIMAGVLIYFFMNTLSIARSSSDPAEMLNIIKENIGAQGIQFMKLESSSELMVGSNLIRLIDGIQNGETSFNCGKSIITELLIYIPRSIYPNRPQTISEKFVDVFYPGTLELGGGYGFFCLQEGYWAFGFIGVFIFMFFYGASVEMIYRWFIKGRKSDFMVLCYALIYFPLVINAVRSGIMGNYKLAIMAELPMLIIFFLPNIKIIKQPKLIGNLSKNNQPTE